MKDICYLSNYRSYTDKEGQVKHLFEVIAGDIDKTTGFVNSGKTHRIVQDTNTLPVTVKFGQIVECDVLLFTYFSKETKSEQTLVKYSNVQPYKPD